GTFKLVSAELAALALFGMCNWAYTWFRVDGEFSDIEVADYFWSWLASGFSAGIPVTPVELIGHDDSD
ncbi:MAG: TetR/AcrR family transcriptional regulator, partial [Ilumatobacter sp.]